MKLAQGGGTIRSSVATRDGDLGREVNVGIRPEDMVMTDEDAFAFEGTVEITEKLGEVTLLYFETSESGKDPVIAKLPGIYRGDRGERLRMTADPAKVHLFVDGQSLFHRG